MEKITEIKKNEVTDFSGDGDFSILYTNDKVFLVSYNNFALHEESNTKNYEHDCDKCIFLGSWGDLEKIKVYDLYFCPQHGEPAILARFGDDGPEYHCSGVKTPGVEAVEVGKEIAKQFNLI